MSDIVDTPPGAPTPDRPRRGRLAAILAGATVAGAATGVLLMSHTGAAASASTTPQVQLAPAGGAGAQLAATTPAASPSSAPRSNENPTHEQGETPAQEQQENSGQGHGPCPGHPGTPPGGSGSSGSSSSSSSSSTGG